MSGRNVVIISVVILVLSMISSVVSLLQPLDNDGKGVDSYGVYPSGQRALVEVLQQLKIPVRRAHSPFDRSLSPQASYVLIGPDVGLLETEAGTLEEMEEWVQSGGQLVISFSEGWPSYGLMKTFSLEGIQITTRASGEPLYETEDFENEEQIPLRMRQFLKKQQERLDADEKPSFQDDINEMITLRAPECELFEIAECTGKLAAACDDVQSLAIRAGEGLAFELNETVPAGVLKVHPGKSSSTVIAEYPHGEGTVVLVADPTLFDNLSLHKGDNSVLLVRLLSEGRELVLFDEFYHGLSIRGNPIWLFAQPKYRIITLLLLGTVALFLWREIPAFGRLPPPGKPPRRTLVAYLDAVSRLLVRSRSQTSQLLMESERAFLWRMARSLKLAGERNQRPAIRARLSRSQPEMLVEFEEIMNQYERFQQAGCSPKELLTLLKRSHRCLS